MAIDCLQAMPGYTLGRDYTPGRLEKACQRDLNHDKASYHTIERILKSGLDQA